MEVEMKARWNGIIEAYREFLPVSENTPVVTLLEGNTPLVEAKKLARAIDFKGTIYLKLEGFNPTGSFKDRGMSLAVSKALEEGAKAIICASTGNASASAAAYGAKAGLPTIVLVPAKGIALGKLAQALICGAKIVPINGSFDDCRRIVKEICQRYPVTIVDSSSNTYCLDGQKTAAFEICDDLGHTPHYHFIPIGNAANIVAYYRGYAEYWVKSLAPKMMGFQAGDPGKTKASAIRIVNPSKWPEAVDVIRDSGGRASTVTDEEMAEAYKLLAQTEGIFVELASAASLAGLIKMRRFGAVSAGIVVCTLTGNGLKDPNTALKSVKLPTAVEPDLEKIIKTIGF
jgi:threonine synthase